ncbi:MAG: cyclic nucleotide-binding domain-containing protein, partial [bacterium]|nr:cyclic nucleotide-binding domain-containing protein [bacterium]
KAFIRDLAARTHMVVLEKGEPLFLQGDNAELMHLVIEGRLQVIIETRNGKKSVVKELCEGAPVGIIALLVGGKRNAGVFALRETILAEMHRETFRELIAKYPDVKQKLLDIVSFRLKRSHLAEVLPEYFEEMDEATFDYIESLFEWVHIERGEILFNKGDIGDSLYILINGILNVVQVGEEEGAEGALNKLVAVIHKGKIVGEMALLSDEKRTAAIYAARDSDLVKLSRAAFESISDKYPQVMIAITRILVERLRYNKTGAVLKNTGMNIAVLPVSPGMPISDFSNSLAEAFSAYGSTFLLTQEVLDCLLDKQGISEISKNDPRTQALRAWLAEIEDTYSFTIYQGDESASPWTRRCLNRADQVLLVGESGTSPIPNAVERELFNGECTITSPRKSLILVHPGNTRLPTGTAAWLEERNVPLHQHVRWHNKTDFSRLARILGNRAVGLALSGGAAKGIAHIGVIRALREAGIPIDMVAGASMGAHIGAYFAMGNSYENLLEMCKKIFIESNPFRDYTLPLISLMKGRKMDRTTIQIYGDSYIEDLWCSYFCVSSNLSRSEIRVHRRGLLRDAVTTSSAVPGVMSPVIKEGEVYVDGGVINNLPGDILRRLCGCVIVVDVSPSLDLSVKMDNVPSPWKLLWSKLLPFKKSIKMPTILDILLSTILTGSFMAANSVKNEADLSLSPPLSHIGFLEFKKMKEVAEIGYRYTKETLEKIKDPKLLATLKGH